LKILECFRVLEYLLHLFGQFNFHLLLICWQSATLAQGRCFTNGCR
jgi:hypothetical protein